MTRFSAYRLLLLAGTIFGLALPNTSHAGSFALREQSTIGQGEAYAGAAAGGAGLGSMFWNPATITDFQGRQVNVNTALILPYANVTPTTGTSPTLLGLGGADATGNILPAALLPSAYTTFQLNDRLWLGFATNSPFGLISKAPTDYAGQIYARTSKVVSYDFNPTIAYKANDWLSFGFGLQALYFETKLSQALNPLHDAPSATVKQDDLGLGFTAGLTVKPRQGTELGLGYRSSVAENTSGTLSLGNAAAAPSSANLRLPDQFNVGLRQAVTQDLNVSAGYEWTRWSRLGTVTVNNSLIPFSMPFHYHDGAYASLGADYRLTNAFTVRGGLGYEWSPIDLDNRSLRVPDSDRLSLHTGLGYRLSDKISLDIAYAHLFSVGRVSVAIVPGNAAEIAGLPLVAKASTHANLLSAGLTLVW